MIKDLRQLGADWVISRAMFYNSKLSLDHLLYGIAKTLNVGRRISNGVYYFRYNVLIIPGQSENDPLVEPNPQYATIINATYTISFRPKNGKVSVTSYRYSVKFPERLQATLTDAPFYVDPTLGDGPSDDDIDYVVEHAIKDGSLRDGKYSLGKVYKIFQAEDHVYYDFLVTLVRTDGYTVRAHRSKNLIVKLKTKNIVMNIKSILIVYKIFRKIYSSINMENYLIDDY